MSDHGDIWSSLLKSVGGTNAIPSGTLLLLGGTRTSQTELIQQIQKASQLDPSNKITRASTPPEFPAIANKFSLGYTYVEFKDVEHDDKLAHLDIYTMENEQQLVKDFIIKQATKEKPFLAAIVLDWRDGVHEFAKTLRDWIAVIKSSLAEVDAVTLDRAKDQLRHRLQTYVIPGTTENVGVELPFEKGQYDSPIGIDLLIICTNSNYTHSDSLSDETVDYTQQFLRTIALKHGASLIYTSPGSGADGDDNLARIITERLQIPGGPHVEPRVIDQSRILIPAGWDTLGKIQAVRDEQFPPDISESWDVDISLSNTDSAEIYSSTIPGAVDQYVATLQKLHPIETSKDDETIGLKREPKTDYQEFLSKNFELLDARNKREQVQTASPFKRNARQFGAFNAASVSGVPSYDDINISGIRTETVDEVLRRIRNQEVTLQQPKTPNSNGSSPTTSPYMDVRSSDNFSPTRGSPLTHKGVLRTPSLRRPSEEGSKSQTEVLETFFQKILDRNSEDKSPTK